MNLRNKQGTPNNITMEEKELADLIDLYLFDRIQSDDFARLQFLRKTNPETDLRVRESIEAFKVLKYLRYKQLRQKLHQIDSAEEITGIVLHRHRWIYITLFIVIAFLSFWIWAGNHYKPESIASRYFKATPEYFIIYEELKEEDLNKWLLAINAFNQKNYPLAIEHFLLFEKNENYEISTIARWNLLLARLALHGPDIAWKEEIMQFQSTSMEPFRSESNRLLRIIISPWYRFFILHESDQLSALKPRLM